MLKQLFDYGILKDAGKVSAEIAKLHAETEFEKYRVIQDRLYRIFEKANLPMLLYLPLSACAWYLHLYISLPPLVMYLLVCSSAFAGAIILYEIIRRIPVLRWCVCGIGGEK